MEQYLHHSCLSAGEFLLPRTAPRRLAADHRGFAWRARSPRQPGKTQRLACPDIGTQPEPLGRVVDVDRPHVAARTAGDGEGAVEAGRAPRISGAIWTAEARSPHPLPSKSYAKRSEQQVQAGAGPISQMSSGNPVSRAIARKPEAASQHVRSHWFAAGRPSPGKAGSLRAIASAMMPARFSSSTAWGG